MDPFQGTDATMRNFKANYVGRCCVLMIDRQVTSLNVTRIFESIELPGHALRDLALS
jgi:hypothetical protein